MPDVFISYAKEDSAVAQILISALEEQDLSVWWDNAIPKGQNWRRDIFEALNSSTCVIVLWSQHSIESEWVQDEAANDKSRLIPVIIENVRPPLGFRSYQFVDLCNWDGEKEDSRFIELQSRIDEMLRILPRDSTELKHNNSVKFKRRSDLTHFEKFIIGAVFVVVVAFSLIQ